jgi:hypothetical protein
MLASHIILCAFVFRVRIIRSAVPLLCWVYGGEGSKVITCWKCFSLVEARRRKAVNKGVGNACRYLRRDAGQGRTKEARRRRRESVNKGSAVGSEYRSDSVDKVFCV